jgi:hypothetical protein
MNTHEEWLPMREVAKRLNISYGALSRLVSLGKLPSRTSDIDRRVRLVEVNQVKRKFEEG